MDITAQFWTRPSNQMASCTYASLALMDKTFPLKRSQSGSCLFLIQDLTMRPHRSVFLSTAACAVTLLFSAGATAQQTASSSSSATAAPVNNSAVNRRDRSSQTKTPTDQPNDKSDIKVAAAVRRAIVKDKSLSMSAHNLKLIAEKGVVTLRGPVKNADEKAKVEADVRGVAGVTSVDNQLDVKN